MGNRVSFLQLVRSDLIEGKGALVERQRCWGGGGPRADPHLVRVDPIIIIIIIIEKNGTRTETSSARREQVEHLGNVAARDSARLEKRKKNFKIKEIKEKKGKGQLAATAASKLRPKKKRTEVRIFPFQHKKNGME